MSYSPPPLPEYLARTHTLETIIGVPTDEQVKAIHDSIRAVNSVSNVPALYDSRLSAQLAQHLFTIQMAVYRNQYPLNVFPGENTYTPPSIPSHIPISLQSIIGAPSDEELDSAHSAVRTLENLANSPFCDSTLSVKLSQHVFNIQFGTHYLTLSYSAKTRAMIARYIKDSNQGHFTPRSVSLPPQPQANDSELLVGTSSQFPDAVEQQDVAPTEFSSNTTAIPLMAPPSHDILEPASVPQPSPQSNDNSHATQRETNRLLMRNEELLKDIRRALVASHFSTHRSPSSSDYAYRTMNEKGELPWMYQLPNTIGYADGSLSWSVVGQELVGYLRFYNIGTELFEEGTEDLQPGKEVDAQKLLGKYLYRGCQLAPKVT